MSRNGKKCKTSFAVLRFRLYILQNGTDNFPEAVRTMARPQYFLLGTKENGGV